MKRMMSLKRKNLQIFSNRKIKKKNLLRNKNGTFVSNLPPTIQTLFCSKVKVKFLR